MGEPIIRVENLSKKYRLTHQEKQSYNTLRDEIAERFASIGKKRDRKPKQNFEEFWALKDVSFEIQQGDRLGIIGHNGAGKSTLLKILSRITEPTSGAIRVKGRIASLLEVGTGFHPELTGRENIFLNGAILGMSKAEIHRKFDEIVAFAGVEKFLDTPVKRYSSGMYVRLAFAVAAHLEPEVLIVDEVLAVGDVAFQEKCLGKMQDISRNDGRTIVFVSHSVTTVQKLCSVAILLKKGEIVECGSVNDVINGYLEASPSAHFKKLPNPLKPTIVEAWLENPVAAHTKYIELHLKIHSPEHIKSAIELQLATPTGMPVCFAAIGTFDYSQMIYLKNGLNEITLLFEASNLAIGQYLVSLDLTDPYVEYFDRCISCLKFDVVKPTEETRFLEQAFNFGCIELPLHLESHFTSG